jgi:SM-20-related protein
LARAIRAWQRPPARYDAALRHGAGEEVRLAAVAEKGLADALACLDLEALGRAPVATEPFPYLVVPGFVPPAARAALATDFPRIDQPGSFPVADLNFGPAFARFLAELEGASMRAAFAEKFGMDLAGRPTTITVRGQAKASDGRIHADARSKLITVLIYMNEAWEAPGGRLRLLRSRDDLEDMVAEVPPDAGTLLAFRVPPHSWHGHEPASGPRRVIQLNWVTSAAVVRRERWRHGASARWKRLFAPRA